MNNYPSLIDHDHHQNQQPLMQNNIQQYQMNPQMHNPYINQNQCQQNQPMPAPVYQHNVHVNNYNLPANQAQFQPRQQPNVIIIHARDNECDADLDELYSKNDMPKCPIRIRCKNCRHVGHTSVEVSKEHALIFWIVLCFLLSSLVIPFFLAFCYLVAYINSENWTHYCQSCKRVIGVGKKI